MKVRWLILCAAGAVVLAAWAAVAITYFFDPNLATWATVVTIAAFSTEGFLWVAAGVLGWSFLAKRRAALTRFKQRFFGGARRPAE